MSLANQSERVEQAIAALQQFSRRDFLKFAAVSAGVASVGMAGLPSSAWATVPEGIHFMGDAEYKVFHQLMQVTLLWTLRCSPVWLPMC